MPGTTDTLGAGRADAAADAPLSIVVPCPALCAALAATGLAESGVADAGVASAGPVGSRPVVIRLRDPSFAVAEASAARDAEAAAEQAGLAAVGLAAGRTAFMTGDAGLVAVADGFAAAGCGIEPTSDGTPGIRLDVSELGRELAGGWPVSVSSSGSGLLLTRVSDLVTDADGGEPDDEA